MYHILSYGILFNHTAPNARFHPLSGSSRRQHYAYNATLDFSMGSFSVGVPQPDRALALHRLSLTLGGDAWKMERVEHGGILGVEIAYDSCIKMRLVSTQEFWKAQPGSAGKVLGVRPFMLSSSPGRCTGIGLPPKESGIEWCLDSSLYGTQTVHCAQSIGWPLIGTREAIIIKWHQNWLFHMLVPCGGSFWESIKRTVGFRRGRGLPSWRPRESWAHHAVFVPPGQN